MFNLQGSEIIVILLLALVVLGPEKLPDAIRRFTQTYNELKKMGSGFQSELKSALDEPMREMRETADLVMNAADPEKVAAEAEAEVAARAQQSDESVEIDERAFLVNDPAYQREQEAVDPEPAARINQIAAANSSAAISAATVDTTEADADDEEAERGEDDRGAGLGDAGLDDVEAGNGATDGPDRAGNAEEATAS